MVVEATGADSFWFWVSFEPTIALLTASMGALAPIVWSFGLLADVDVAAVLPLATLSWFALWAGLWLSVVIVGKTSTALSAPALPVLNSGTPMLAFQVIAAASSSMRETANIR